MTGTDSSPIFVVGMNGSGTTMLLDCLDNHPELYGFRRETKIIPYFIATLGKYGDLNNDDNFRRLWDDFRHVPHFRHVNNGIVPPLPDNWRETPRSLASVIDGVFSFFSSMEGKKHWCEKTPMHAQHITSLAKLFPHARFIHIIRDGRASAASFYRRWRYKPELTIYRWKHVVREARMQGATVSDRYMEVFYEKLTSDPETWMKKICEFLQIPFTDKVLSVSRTRTFTGSAEKSIVSNAEKWRNDFDDKMIQRLEKIAGKTLAELGYSTANPHAEQDPPNFVVKSWLYKDYVRSGFGMLWREMTGQNGKWDDFSTRILNAIRQRLTTKY